MWHVKYDTVLGAIVFHYEYASGFLGIRDEYLVRHAVDKDFHAACGADQHRKIRHTRFDPKRRPINCKRCLMILNANRNLDFNTNWEED